jgi:hypothetical protein
MNKPVAGIIAGAILGILDGATSWFTPAARPQITGILMGSCFKGVLVGIASGFFARKVNSNAAGILFGSVVGLILAYAVAALPQPDGHHYYLEIMLPGFVTGALIGYLTQRADTAPKGGTYAKTSAL